MEFLGTMLAGLGLLILFAPLISLLVMAFVLVPLAHLLPHPQMVARASFACPFSKRQVNVAFLTAPASRAPTDVLSCSLFGDGGVRCKKGCLDLTESAWTGRPVVARFALIADGEAYRN